MKIRSEQDFWSGLMFLAAGAFFAWRATGYARGTAAHMGPGYFPFWLGILLAVLGAGIALAALSPRAAGSRIERFDWRVAGWIVGTVVLYGAVLEPLGVYVSIFLLVILGSLAGRDFDWRVAAGNGAFLAVFAYLAFIKGLGLVFPLWPFGLGR